MQDSEVNEPMQLDAEDHSGFTESTHLGDESSVISEHSDTYLPPSEPESEDEEDMAGNEVDMTANEFEKEPEYYERMSKQLTVQNVDQFLKQYFDPFYTTLQRQDQGRKRIAVRHMVRKMNAMIQGVLRTLSVVQEFGLCDEHFELLVDVIVSYGKEYKLKGDLFELLIPRGTIPAHIFMKIISLLHTMNRPLVENNLVDWLVTVYRLIEEKDKIEKLYGVVFKYLESSQVRNSVCHLLYLMTKSTHINKYRTDRLLELLEGDKESRYLMGLLMVYRQYDDTIVVPFNIRFKTNVIFESPFPLLEKQIEKVQQLWGARTDDEVNRKEFLLSNGIRTVKKVKGKNSKISTLVAPKPPSTFFFDSNHAFQKASDPGNINMQALMVTADGAQLLNHLVALNPDSRLIQGASTVINEAIYGSLAAIKDPADRANKLEEQFDHFLGFARFHKHHLSSFDTYLQSYIKNWNGYEFVDQVFEMISYINPLSYDDLHKNYLIPLYRLFCVSKITWKAKMIQCFADLLNNWGLVDWKKHFESRQEESNQDVEKITNRLVHLQLDVDYFETIRKLIRFIDRVSVFGLVLEQDDATLQHASLSFFETVTLVYLELDFPEIIIPSPAFVYRHFFSKNVFAISRICGIISEYKKAFEYNEKEEEEEWRFETTAEQMGVFNGYMTDICNALWMNKAFVKGEGNLRFQLSDDLIKSIMDICSEKGNDLNEIGSLVQSPATCNFTKKFAQSLDGGASALCTKAVTPDTFKQVAEEEGIVMNYSEFKREYLDYLSGLGFKGYHELLFSCMSSLRKVRDSSSSHL